MFEQIPFRKIHILPLLDQKINQGLRDHFLPTFADELEKEGKTITGLVNGEVMFCGGMTDYWKNRGIVWIVFNDKSKNCFVPVFRAIKNWCENHPNERIEMTVPVDDRRMQRRARMLGFELEAPLMRKFLPRGEDCMLYALVKREKGGSR